jgi:outer membrane lipase/esterase
MILSLRARRVALVLLALLAAIVAGCGGGTSQVQAYSPRRLIVFGDETSALVDDGNHNAWKYSVNAIDATTNERDCNQLQIWVQGLAAQYGFVFAECNPTGIVNPKALMRAQPGARVEDPAIGLEQQISTEAGHGLGTGDLVTVLIGANDIVDLFSQVQNGQLSQPDAISEARRRGGVTAGQINRLLALNTRVILSTVPDLGKTPFAVTADELVAGSSGLLHQLTYEYNAYLRTRIDATKYDGRNYGLVLADDMVGAAVSSPSSYLAAPANVTDALCVTALPYCTTDPSNLTPAPGASTSSYLWADSLHVGPTMHAHMASQAVARATTNPF